VIVPSDDEIVFGGPAAAVLNPLQKPGQDEIVAKFRWPGSAGVGERRLYVDREVIHKLLRLTEGTPTGRAVIHGVQLEVERRRRPDGTTYDVWAFTGIPAAEGSLRDQAIRRDLGAIAKRSGS
jgi:hypothetical protein